MPNTDVSESVRLTGTLYKVDCDQEQSMTHVVLSWDGEASLWRVSRHFHDTGNSYGTTWSGPQPEILLNCMLSDEYENGDVVSANFDWNRPVDLTPPEVTDEVGLFMAKRPHASRKHVEYAADLMHQECIPFCRTCFDWHFPGEDHSS